MDYSNPLKNAKHEQFAQYVSNGDSATKSYILAGYSEKGAEQNSSRLIRNDEVLGRIEYLRQTKAQIHKEAVEKAVEASGLTKEWVINQLIDNVKIAKAADPVCDENGNPIGEYKTNLAAANKALELLGKEIGMFIERKEVGNPGDFGKMGDDELDRAIDETQRAIERARNQCKAAGFLSKK